MPITLLDGVLIGLTLVSAVLAMVRGFSREVLSIASWALAAVAAFFLYKPLTPIAQSYISSETFAKIAAGGAVFVVALIVVTFITMRIADMIIDSRIGPLDRTLGFVFGAVRGIIVVAVALLFFNWLVGDRPPTWVAEAKSKPLLDQVGERIVRLLPEDTDEILGKIKGEEAAPEGEAPAAN